MVCDPAPVSGAGRRQLKLIQDGAGRSTRCVIPLKPPTLCEGDLRGDNQNATGRKQRPVASSSTYPTHSQPLPVRT
ncbi:hypothetical protein, partial [Nitrosovibrio sp. Nv6]|uniref:hypothetical protein n=1 Tax=Nitrosovibrio sp. Nv6 TaxID=1855340 RepID=UPI001C42FDDC